MMNYMFSVAAKAEIVRLSAKYGISIPIIVFNDLPFGVKGNHSWDIINHCSEIVIDVDQHDSFDAVYVTARHEFRHAWQYATKYPEAIFWHEFYRRNKDDNNFYWYAAHEIDARLFARSNGVKDDESIFDSLKINDLVGLDDCKILQLCQKVATAVGEAR